MKIMKEMMMNDVLIKNSRVIDPGMGIDGNLEILVRDGRIAAVEEKIAVSDGIDVFDAKGLIVTPGFIDLHAHVAQDLVPLAVEPDSAGVYVGVTTVCDAGSVGWVNFPPFEKYIISRAQTRVLSFLHLAPFGEALMPEIGYEAIDEQALETTLENHQDVIRGVKLRLVEDVILRSDVNILELGFRIAKQAGLPVMVHIGMSPRAPVSREKITMYTKRLLGLLKAGDVITHAFTDKPGAVFNLDGEPVEGLKAALDRGVLLDAAPGRGHLNFRLAQAAISRGYQPAALGTDVVQFEDDQPHFFNVAAVMSKFMALGVSLNQAVAAVTTNPARITGIDSIAGSLAHGMPADLTIFRLHKGQFKFHDGRAMNTISGDLFISPQYCLREGKCFTVRESVKQHVPTPKVFQAYLQTEMKKMQKRMAKTNN